MKHLRRIDEKLYFGKELAEEIAEYSYILKDEGYKVTILQYESNRMHLFIKPETNTKINKLTDKAITNSLIKHKKLQSSHKKIMLNDVIYFWPELLYYEIKNKDFFIEWLDRITEICSSNGYDFHMNKEFGDYRNDGIVFYIRKRTTF